MNAEVLRNLKTKTDDEFYKCLEHCVGFPIPVEISKILIFNYYNTAITLSKFDDTSVKDIEDVMRFTFNKTMVKKGDPITNYLGRFVDDQTKFKLIGGQVRLIYSLVEYCRNLYKETTSQQTSQPDNPVTIAALDLNSEGSVSNSSKQNILFKRIGAQMLTVFNDAKRITLSAWSWPSRQVASKLSEEFEKKGHVRDVDINFQYLTPSHHADLLDSIVQADIPNFVTKIENAVAVSARLDGSVDRTQKHNMYVMVHLVAANLAVSTYFVGFSVPKSGGNAKSCLQAAKDSTTRILPWDKLFQKVTSLVTDGEYLNTGSENGIWTLLKKERSQSCNPEVPLLLIWCVAHRLNLAWKSLCAKLPIIYDLVQDVKNLSSYFHSSGERTQQLKNVSLANPCEFQKHIQYPKYFEIRWTEFTHDLFTSVLRNWKASIHYFTNAAEVGLKKHWLCYDRIHLLVFLADVLTLFKAFQKSCESDTISLTEVSLKKQNLFAKFQKLKNVPLDLGWEEMFLKNFDNSNYSFYGHTLTKKRGRSRGASKSFDTNKRILILDTFVQYINDRLERDINIQDSLQPLLTISSMTSVQSLTLCHSLVVPDVDKAVFLQEYFCAAELLNQSNDKLVDSLHSFNTIADNFPTLKLAVARAVAAKPHTADVERLIRTYNQFKNPDRSSLESPALFNYLYVNTNMTTLEEFDPTAAAELWVNMKDRRSCLTPKAKQQEWFSGVFEDAGKNDRVKNTKILF